MTAGARNNGIWAAFALVLLAIGLDTAQVADLNSSWLARLAEVWNRPTDGPLALLAVGILLQRLRHGVASVTCMLGVAGWTGLELAHRLSVDGAAEDWVATSPVALCLLLSVSALLYALPLSQPARFSVTASLCMAVMGAAVAILIAEALDPSAPAATLSAATRTLGSLALGMLWFDYLVRGAGRVSAVIRTRLVKPTALGGIAGTVVLAWLVSRFQSASSSHGLNWVVVSALLVLWVTAGAVASLSLSAANVRLMGANRNLKRLLARQRRIMHTRAADIRRSHAHYRALFENVPTPVVLTSPEGKVIAANPALLDLLGLDSEDELASKSFSSFYADPQTRRRLLDEWHDSDDDVHRGKLDMRRNDGEIRNVLYSLRTIRGPDRSIEYIQGAITDITELRRAEASRERLESHLRLSQKLESVGRLAAGIAHEINTPMQYIGDNVYYLRQSFELIRELLVEQHEVLNACADQPGRELAERLRAIETRLELQETCDEIPGALDRATDGIQNVNQIVAAMKELAHPGQGGKASTNINDLVQTALTLTRNTYKTVAAVELDLRDVPNALTYKNELCQVLINLIVNATHAIEAAIVSGLSSGRICIGTALEGDDIVIRVEDNGCGIPEAAIDKIFDPFFTTKGVGKGTGQGLALARATIVDKHEGELSVQSTVGSGTAFTIRLPTRTADGDSTTQEAEKP